MDKKTQKHINARDVYQIRISNMVDQLMLENWAMRERLDRMNIINSLTNSMQKKYPPEQFLLIETGDLRRRIGQRMATEALYGLLSDLTPEQVSVFEDAVAGR